MNLCLTRTFYYSVFFIFTSIVLILSCSKDIDTLRDAVIDDEEISIKDPDLSGVEDDDFGNEQETTEFEARITNFPSIQDAYLQNGQGYDQTIVRLEENRRTSYLMFDLSQIDSIKGVITGVDLEFIINTDDGSGTVEVFKGISSNWTENNLTNRSAPEAVELLGSINNEFYVDNEVRISLDASKLSAEALTLILDHKDGDDLAFASKENKNKLGPKLVVSYNAPFDAEVLEIESPQEIEETPEEVTPEEETTQEETPEEETPEEETPQEETPEEETPEEETPQEETPEEETPEEETPEEETPEEETPEEETPEEDQDQPTEQEEPNIGPTAAAEATPNNGIAPLQVSLSGDNSSDDKAVTGYLWDFKDGGTSNNRNTTHTFNDPGTYSVELTVTDEQGLTDKDVVVITVSAPVNNPPVAVASANITTGNAPLLVNFTGSNSSDDQGINSYRWEFKDGSSSTQVNPSHTFNLPGTYYVDLFVTDAQGLSDFAGVTIIVEEEIVIDNSCSTNGGFANTSGLKTWCWGDVSVPSGASTGRDAFSGGQLALSVECSSNQVVQEGDRLKFKLNPTTPNAASWCNNDYNMRSEIRTMPWQVNQPLGTEEWIGWSYTFGNNYVVDNHNPWLFFQMHQGVSGSPPFEFTVVPSILYGAQNGEVVIINHANKTETDRTRTGIVPSAGTTLNIVVHVVHDLGSKGKLEVWINSNKVYDKQVGTVHAASPWGGNAKFGIYKWPWKTMTGVQNSINQGITNNLETYMGPLRIITRRPGDSNYGQNSYNVVVPR